MLPVPACGSKTRRWHSHRSACSAVAPGGMTPNRNRGRPCSWPSGRGPRPPPPQSAPSVFAAATRPPTAASGSQSSDRSVENCSLPGYHQGASRWRYSTPANPIKSDRLLGDTVNIAARLEQETKAVGLPLVVSRAFLAAAGETVDGRDWQQLGARTLRGRAQPVDLFGRTLLATLSE